MKPSQPTIIWKAPRVGHDWTCPDTARAVAWFRSLADESRLESRLDACREYYERNREAAEDGLLAGLFDPNDATAWYILQADTFATDRRFWTPDEAARTVPYLKRIGQLHERLAQAEGVEERIARFVNGDARQPEGPIYELLVAGAWIDRGYKVRFVPERPGMARTRDLEATKGKTKWAIEAKRMLPSDYRKRELKAGRCLAAQLHELSEALGHSVVVDVIYHHEISEYPIDFLANCVREHLPVHEAKEIQYKDALVVLRSC